MAVSSLRSHFHLSFKIRYPVRELIVALYEPLLLHELPCEHEVDQRQGAPSLVVAGYYQVDELYPVVGVAQGDHGGVYLAGLPYRLPLVPRVAYEHDLGLHEVGPVRVGEDARHDPSAQQPRARYLGELLRRGNGVYPGGGGHYAGLVVPGEHLRGGAYPLVYLGEVEQVEAVLPPLVDEPAHPRSPYPGANLYAYLQVF